MDLNDRGIPLLTDAETADVGMSDVGVSGSSDNEEVSKNSDDTEESDDYQEDTGPVNETSFLQSSQDLDDSDEDEDVTDSESSEDSEDSDDDERNEEIPPAGSRSGAPRKLEVAVNDALVCVALQTMPRAAKRRESCHLRELFRSLLILRRQSHVLEQVPIHCFQ